LYEKYATSPRTSFPLGVALHLITTALEHQFLTLKYRSIASFHVFDCSQFILSYDCIRSPHLNRYDVIMQHSYLFHSEQRLKLRTSAFVSLVMTVNDLSFQLCNLQWRVLCLMQPFCPQGGGPLSTIHAEMHNYTGCGSNVRGHGSALVNFGP
jgi:hypothetical protein